MPKQLVFQILRDEMKKKRTRRALFLSNAIRSERSRTSGEYLFVFLFKMLHSIH
jgi:hypothetical protein